MKPFMAKLSLNKKYESHRLIIPLLEDVGSPYIGKDFRIYFSDSKLLIEYLSLYHRLVEEDEYEKSNFILENEHKRVTIKEMFEIGPSLIGEME